MCVKRAELYVGINSILTVIYNRKNVFEYFTIHIFDTIIQLIFAYIK